MRITYYKKDDKTNKECTTIKEAKKLIKEQSGKAWIEIYERDGTMCEVIPIK